MEKEIEETLKNFTKLKYFREGIHDFFMGLNRCLDKRQPDIKNLKLIKFYFGENLKTKKLEKFEESYRCYLYFGCPGIQNIFKKDIDKYNYEVIWQIDDDFYLFKLFDLNLYNKDQYYKSEEYKKDCLLFDNFFKSLEAPMYYFFTKESFVCDHPKSVTDTKGDSNLNIITNIQKIVPELVKENKLLQNEFYICVIKDKGSTFYIQFETSSSEFEVNIIDLPKEFKKNKEIKIKGEIRNE